MPDNTLLNNGRYIILSKIAQGGMGAVYKALDQKTGQVCAIKEMSDAALKPEERQGALDDFRREAAILSRLRHPSLPGIIESYFYENGQHYMAMEFVEGRTLEKELQASPGPLPEAQVLDLAGQLMDVLEYLHSQKPPIIYRDLKPANVMVSRDPATGKPRIKLIDFGIARFHKPGQRRDTEAFGTQGYAPPEQYGKSQTDARSDIYALGVLLHQLLTKYDPTTTPFMLPPVRQLNPNVSPQVEAAIAKALQIDPTKRPQSIAEFRNLLFNRSARPATVVSPAPQPARIGTSTRRPSPPVARPVRDALPFRSGEVARSPIEFARIAQATPGNWQEAARMLREGRLEAWLQDMGEDGLMRVAETLRKTGGDMNQRLEEFLRMANPTLRAPRPTVTTTSGYKKIDLGTATRNKRLTGQFTIANTDRGYLLGRVAADSPWLVVTSTDPRFYADGNTGQGRFGLLWNDRPLSFTVEARPGTLAPGTQQGNVRVEWENNTADIPVTMTVPALPPSLERVPDVEAGTLPRGTRTAQTVMLKNGGNVPLTVEVVPEVKWLDAEPRQLVVQQAEPLTLKINTDQLPPTPNQPRTMPNFFGRVLGAVPWLLVLSAFLWGPMIMPLLGGGITFMQWVMVIVAVVFGGSLLAGIIVRIINWHLWLFVPGIQSYTGSIVARPVNSPATQGERITVKLAVRPGPWRTVAGYAGVIFSLTLEVAIVYMLFELARPYIQQVLGVSL